MNILFRVDCNKKNGSGHFSRCISLAKHLKKSGNEIYFLTVNFDKKFYSKNINFKILNNNSNYISDINLTTKVIAKKKIDVVVLDNYFLNKKWCQKISKKVKKLVVIDDNQKSKFKNTILVDHTRKESKKKNEYFGLKYFLLDKKYLQINKKTKINRDIFINFGSGNFDNYLYKILNIINNLNFFLKITLVLNEENKIDTSSFKNLKIYKISKFSFLGKYISKSKFCIGSGGVNLIERLYLNKLNLVFSTAKHQETICNNLKKQKMIIYLNHLNKKNIKKSQKKIKNNIIKIMNSKKITKKNQLLDGQGIRRVSNIISNIESID